MHTNSTMTSSQQQSLSLHSCAYMILHTVDVATWWNIQNGCSRGRAKRAPLLVIIIILLLLFETTACLPPTQEGIQIPVVHNMSRNDDIVFTCKEGYNSSKSLTTSCLCNGTWTEDPNDIICTGQKCQIFLIIITIYNIDLEILHNEK